MLHCFTKESGSAGCCRRSVVSITTVGHGGGQARHLAMHGQQLRLSKNFSPHPSHSGIRRLGSYHVRGTTCDTRGRTCWSQFVLSNSGSKIEATLPSIKPHITQTSAKNASYLDFSQNNTFWYSLTLNQHIFFVKKTRFIVFLIMSTF